MGRVLQFDRKPKEQFYEKVYITCEGVYIDHTDNLPLDKFNGQIADLLSIMIAHEELEISLVKFYVMEYCRKDGN